MKSKEIMPFVMVYRDENLDIENILRVVKSTEPKIKDDLLDKSAPMCYEPEVFIDKGSSVFSGWEEWFDFGILANVNDQPSGDDINKEHLDIVQSIMNSLNSAYSSYIDRWINSKEMNSHNEIMDLENSNLPRIFKGLVKHWDISLENRVSAENMGEQGKEGWVDTTIAFVKYVKDYPKDFILNFHVDDGVGEEDAGPHATISSLVYLNDDYDQGDILFINEFDNKVYRYSPKAGDILVFPSYRPFFHAALPAKNGFKYFARHFLTWRSNGSENWKDNLKKYGEETWIDIRHMIRKTENEMGFYGRQVIYPGGPYEAPSINVNGMPYFADALVHIDNDW